VRFLDDGANDEQGGVLNGGDGDDILILTGGDTATGGAGEDRFVLDEDMRDERTVVIEDFTADEDVIALEYDGQAPDVEVRDQDGDAVILIAEDVIARVSNGAGLTLSQVRLVEAGA